MNEQIKKLADEAARYSAVVALPTGESGDNLFVERFAELIVEECRYVMDCNKGSDQHTEWNRALFETSLKIKQHFGVTE